jgi:hypothetical protein
MHDRRFVRHTAAREWLGVGVRQRIRTVGTDRAPVFNRVLASDSKTLRFRYDRATAPTRPLKKKPRSIEIHVPVAPNPKAFLSRQRREKKCR